MYSPYFTQVKSQPVLTSECVKYQSLVKFDDVVTLVTSVLEAVECSSITSGKSLEWGLAGWLDGSYTGLSFQRQGVMCG